ncbi:insulinase family protein [Corallococcus sp. H22C18031201]|nr:insulinase family protein [Corallococcus sp. H22C18031201]
MPRVRPFGRRSLCALPGVLSLLALTLGGCATVPPRGQLVMRDTAFPLRDFRLGSGLRVVVEQDSRAPVVAVAALVGVGSSNDPQGKEGLAHLVEHLAFRARHGGTASVWTRLEQSGAGRFNAFTGMDHTVYETMGPRESLPALLALEGQRLAAPLDGVTPDVFTVEREVVRNELRQRNESGYVGKVTNWAFENAFPEGHPYARPGIGTHASLTATTLADAQRFARLSYRPENVTIVISGDVELTTVDALINKALPPSWVGSGPPLALEQRLPRDIVEPPVAPAAKELVTHEAAVTSPELYVSWVLPRGFDEASAVQEFVASSLDSSLMRAAWNDGDIAYIDTGLIRGTRASLLLVRVVLNKGDHPKRSLEKVLDEVRHSWSDTNDAAGVAQREQTIVEMRRHVAAGMVLDSEDLLARAVRRAELTHFMTDARAFSRAQGALLSLSGSKVTGFAYQWLQRSRARAFLVRPGATGVGALKAPSLLIPDETVASAPPVTPSLSAFSAPVKTVRLDNGVEVVMVPRPGLPLVRVGVALKGGEVSGPSAVATLANLGASAETSYEGSPSDWGLHTRKSLRSDQVRYEVAGPAGNVGNMLAITAEKLSTMRITEPVVKFIHDELLPWTAAADARPGVIANRQLMQALYGKHLYAQPATYQTLSAVDWESTRDWVKVNYTPANAVVVIAGEFDMAQVEPLARKYLGGWGAKGPAVAPPAPPEPPAAMPPTLYITPVTGATQASLSVACRLPAATPEAEARYAVMAELARARLWTQVRQQRGASYGFDTQVSVARGGAAHLLVEGVVDSPQLGMALGVARRMFASFAKDGVPAAELERARTRLMTQAVVDFSSTEAWVDALLDARVRDFSAESVAQRPTLIQGVTSSDLKSEFARCTEHLVMGVQADEAQAKAAAKESSQL